MLLSVDGPQMGHFGEILRWIFCWHKNVWGVRNIMEKLVVSCVLVFVNKVI